jgi:hypothetical protein
MTDERAGQAPALREQLPTVRAVAIMGTRSMPKTTFRFLRSRWSRQHAVAGRYASDGKVNP